MPGVMFISCIRFSMQLLIAEGAFILNWKRRAHFYLRLLSGLAGYFVLALLTFRVCTGIPVESPAVVILYYACLFFISLGLLWYCYDVGFEEVLFGGVCGYATQHIAFAIITIITQMTGISLSPFWDFVWIRFMPYLVIAGTIYRWIVRQNAGKVELRKRDIRMVWLAFAILFTVIIISVMVDHRFFRSNALLLQNVFSKMYAIVCSLLAIFIAFYMSRQNRILHEKEMMESMLHSMGEQQKLSRETINIINIKCHDLKYRISQISKIGDAKDQQEYIRSVKDALAIYDNIFQTGNESLDLVLTEKSLLCNEYNIKLSALVDGKVLDFLSSTDVYALFGNLLDNAIESVLKEPDEEKRIISIAVNRRNQGSHIHVENYCKEKVRFQDGLPLTTKKDTNYHGFGVRSIRYLVERYKGELLMRTEQHRFLVDIVFYPGIEDV